MLFTACLAQPENPREAKLVAEALEALASALRDWPAEAWERVAAAGSAAAQASAATASSGPGTAPAWGGPREGLFERLVAHAAPVAREPRTRRDAIASAEAVAAVLRCLWPVAQGRSAAPPRLAPALVGAA